MLPRNFLFKREFFSLIDANRNWKKKKKKKKTRGGVVIDAQNLLAVDVPSRKFAKSVKKKKFV